MRGYTLHMYGGINSTMHPEYKSQVRSRNGLTRLASPITCFKAALLVSVPDQLGCGTA